MRIGYFGGSFDPPHRGHLAVARAARDRFALDRVLLAPTGRQPLKPGGPEAPFADRLRMTELLCAEEPALKASAIDAPHPDGAPNYTVDTLHRLRAELAAPGSSQSNSRFSGCSPRRGPASSYAKPELFAIVGADAFGSLPKWRDAETLLQLAEWIVVSRPGVPLPILDPATSGVGARADGSTFALSPSELARIHLLDGVAEPVSATALRALLREREDCKGLIPKAVLSYIDARGLYLT